jgi:hypothetical protein
LKQDSVAHCGHVYTVDKTRLAQRAGHWAWRPVARRRAPTEVFSANGTALRQPRQPRVERREGNERRATLGSRWTRKPKPQRGGPNVFSRASG